MAGVVSRCSRIFFGSGSSSRCISGSGVVEVVVVNQKLGELIQQRTGSALCGAGGLGVQVFGGFRSIVEVRVWWGVWWRPCWECVCGGEVEEKGEVGP